MVGAQLLCPSLREGGSRCVHYPCQPQIVILTQICDLQLVLLSSPGSALGAPAPQGSRAGRSPAWGGNVWGWGVMGHHATEQLPVLL